MAVASIWIVDITFVAGRIAEHCIYKTTDPSSYIVLVGKCWFWNVISFRYPLMVHERAYGSYYKPIIAYIIDDFYW